MKQGMIKVSVFYPHEENKPFDLNYYMEKHIPMVIELLGDNLKGATIEKGLGGPESGSSPTYVVMTNMYFDSVADFENSFGPNADTIMGDKPNYTEVDPIIQMSEVIA